MSVKCILIGAKLIILICTTQWTWRPQTRLDIADHAMHKEN